MTHSPNFAFVYIFEHVPTTRDSHRVTGELKTCRGGGEVGNAMFKSFEKSKKTDDCLA